MTCYTVTVRHIDTCHPDYLIDHHNRPGESLEGVCIFRSTTNRDVLTELLAMEWLGMPEGDSANEVYAAIKALFEPFSARLDDPFHSTASSPPDADPDDLVDPPMAWFLAIATAVEDDETNKLSINLDDMDENELVEAGRALGNLQGYATAKLHAMLNRKDGCIAPAQVWERKAQLCYEMLPPAYRW